jgi:hypothetical protein
MNVMHGSRIQKPIRSGVQIGHSRNATSPVEQGGAPNNPPLGNERVDSSVRERGKLNPR